VGRNGDEFRKTAAHIRKPNDRWKLLPMDIQREIKAERGSFASLTHTSGNTPAKKQFKENIQLN
jgi:hypothetical protein